MKAKKFLALVLTLALMAGYMAVSVLADGPGGPAPAPGLTIVDGSCGTLVAATEETAFITLETRNAVPCVPVAALEQAGSDTILYTAHDPEKGTLEKPVKITIGCSDGEYVEVLDGMELGQRCYYEYYDTYQDTEAPLRSSFSFSRSMGRR